MDKKHSQEIHAIRRLQERYGLGVEDYYVMVRLIRNQNKKMPHGLAFLYRESNRRTVWQVDYKGRKVIAVYDSKRGNIITFLNS